MPLTGLLNEGLLKNIAGLQNAAQNTSHRLSRCQVVFTKRIFLGFVGKEVLSDIEFGLNLSF